MGSKKTKFSNWTFSFLCDIFLATSYLILFWFSLPSISMSAFTAFQSHCTFWTQVPCHKRLSLWYSCIPFLEQQHWALSTILLLMMLTDDDDSHWIFLYLIVTFNIQKESKCMNPVHIMHFYAKKLEFPIFTSFDRSFKLLVALNIFFQFFFRCL